MSSWHPWKNNLSQKRKERKGKTIFPALLGVPGALARSFSTECYWLFAEVRDYQKNRQFGGAQIDPLEFQISIHLSPDLPLSCSSSGIQNRIAVKPVSFDLAQNP